eukprot:TRINITY_DN5358_c0_g1_i1.p1 TRINITY_DN5358_c0_g1~~TRINITY_DN5358_c0_g1_i1.p1  ORF type:complete len:304 (+),score=54.35 TRINITY_DN5358_c0_g1_i1:74-985(+)
MSKCFPGGGPKYEKVAEAQGFASGPTATNYTIDAEDYHGQTSYNGATKMDGVPLGVPASNTVPEMPDIQPSSEYPTSATGSRPMKYTFSIFSGCAPGKSGLTANCILLVLLCAAQVGSSMSIGSVVLLADFFRRLSCVFLLIYDLEELQLEEDYGGSNVDVSGIAHRGGLLAKALVGVYLLSASFFMATFALWRMYGHDPPGLSSSGWLILFGTIGAALDICHVFCGVKQTLIHEDTELSRFWWCFLQVYGSLFVLAEGIFYTMSGGHYLDPIMAIFFAAFMAVGNVGPVLAACAEIYHRSRV